MSKILETVHGTAKGLHKAGVLDAKTMREFDALCLPPIKSYTPLQIRRLRTNDGVYFTKFGARKLAHYVERELDRIMGNKGLPVALPIPLDPAPQAATAKPSGPAERPARNARRPRWSTGTGSRTAVAGSATATGRG